MRGETPTRWVASSTRRWWIALGGFVALSAAFGPMWLDWLQALLNSDGSIVYFVQEWPILTLPLAALAGTAGDSRVSDEAQARRRAFCTA
jgi:hypothetical protein